MIDPRTIQLNFIKKEPQTGSHLGMRYQLQRGTNGEEDCMDVTVWPEPFCFSKTPEAQKQLRQFPLTTEGKDAAVAWLNGQYETQKDRWSEALRRPQKTAGRE